MSNAIGLVFRPERPQERTCVRRLPIGAEVQPRGGVHFRVWAPDWLRVDVAIEPADSGQVANLPQGADVGQLSNLPDRSPSLPVSLIPMTAEEGGYGLDGVWNDDVHHTCRVAATGRSEFYYGDYQGTPQEIL